ncbi:5-hydroxytryptamine receptor 3A-like isoform X1 [Entelurus aequoreus]|uniref:5-hydroxytryptamine receptor 3A-like isoform X1 n=1 Tax=Entelurus aequoreus TaxID=161455 RepID=UPI002B1D4917|nr:5-hydroxytryptamine receptor 3A-like isoform X1 [Entelurus aequoreus]
MMLAGFFFSVLLLAGGVPADRVCSYNQVLEHLNVSTDPNLYSMTRPVRDHTKTTVVTLEVILYAILDVRELDQTFIPYVWIFTKWQNDHISWNPQDFCGIENITIPHQVLWKPDLSIEEMVEKDKAPPSPHLTISSSGQVWVQNDQVLPSTCRMHIYKFPFDIQSCDLSFKSVVHSVQEIRLLHSLGSAEATRWSREVMRTQYEWLFVGMSVDNKTLTFFGIEQDMIIYTITMKRRPVLYIINFMLPVLFFLGLDMASFLIPDTGGEKLSFKVTLLLAVTVMQLILNEILPSSTNKIPLIAVYCIGIFALMLLSLLETIVVLYLMDKDGGSEDQSLSEDFNQQADSKGGGDKKWTRCVSICNGPARGNSPELMKDKEQTESGSVDVISEETRDVMRALTVLLNNRKEPSKPSYWSKVITKIHRIFFAFYVTAVTLFLAGMYFIWQSNQDD